MDNTLRDMFPEVVNKTTNEKEQTESAASQLLKKLTDTKTKDTQIALRINSNAYAQLKTIASKKGLRASAVITMLINDYLRDNKNLLDD